MRKLTILGLVFVALFALAACTTRPTAVNPDLGVPLAEATEAVEAAQTEPVEDVASTAEAEGEAAIEAEESAGAAPEDAADVPSSGQGAAVSYTLVTGMGDAGMAFIGQGGDIDGVANPTLTAQAGNTVSITLVNGDGVLHDLTIDEFGVQTEQFATEGQEETVTFTVDEAGEFDYYCSVPGHRQAGMEGLFVVEGESGGAQASADEAGDEAVQGSPVDPEEAADAGYVGAAEAAAPAEPAAEASAQATSIVMNPADVPEAVGARGPETVTVDLTAQELDGLLADGTTYTYWTFNGTVPGPFIRVREGDTVELTLTNEDGSQFPHSIDLHAVNGPGGGEVFTQTAPGDTTSFTFQALNPGLYVYHCATPSVAHHITNGMYGLILVEPEGGLPPVDREFYVMQGEIYTEEPFGTEGLLTESYEKLLN
ncbi:MAG TPA: multicopper oxidase domain-containing protein, partial [Aggregatilineales bacterium]|nr:multicopper oxidase domain-containing protein [Aggregatilineales bacterium]